MVKATGFQPVLFMEIDERENVSLGKTEAASQKTSEKLQEILEDDDPEEAFEAELCSDEYKDKESGESG